MNEPLKGKVEIECAVCGKEGNPCGVVFASDIKSAVEFAREEISKTFRCNKEGNKHFFKINKILNKAFEDVTLESERGKKDGE